MKTINAGNIRLILRSKNFVIKKLKFSYELFISDDVITYPEITKNISTPRYPLGSISLLK